jgi:arginyl-tRNA synthetase
MYIVEHTSVNPAGPIHIGTARNSVLGDTLAKLLEARGHAVSTHFYVDDVGRQIAVLTYGPSHLDTVQPEDKPDHWLGRVYAVTNCALEIKRLRSEVRRLTVKGVAVDALNDAKQKLDAWVADAKRLRTLEQTVFDALFKKIRDAYAPDARVAEIMRLYEAQDPDVKRQIRNVVALCLAGYHETYSRVGIHWDSWDWESDLVWDTAVDRVVAALRETPYTTTVDGALTLNVDAAATKLGLKDAFHLPHDHELPSLVLTRSDGTTLYATRDIAYSLWKLQRADKVINVIGMEQSLSQLQLRIALTVLTSPTRALALTHYAYASVNLPHFRMSKRRGRYVAFDDVLDEAVKRAFDEVEHRSPHLPDALKRRIAEAVGVGAVKYALLSVAPSKQVLFSWEKVLNFETNSAPFIQYAHARACSILKKATTDDAQPDYALLRDPSEKLVIRKLALFPETVVDAADRREPSRITEYTNDLAACFNTFYAAVPVIISTPPELRAARLNLVAAVRCVIRNALKMLGITALERM